MDTFRTGLISIIPFLNACCNRPYIISFVSPLPSEVYVRMLSDKGIAASSGSACSNNSKGEGEKILLSMGIRSNKARNAVRISFSGSTDEESAEALIKAIKEIR